MSFVDSIFKSGADALRFGNLMKRLLLAFFFAIILGLPGLIRNLDSIPVGSGVWGFFKAFSAGLWSGIGVALSTLWDVLTNWSSFVSSGAYGSIGVAVLMIFALLMFFFQPISLLINIFDGKGSDEVGNRSGQATGFLLRFGITVFVVLLLVVLFGRGGDSLASNINDTVVVNGSNSSVVGNVTLDNVTFDNSSNVTNDGGLSAWINLIG